jgi:hypothetical protein
MSGLGLIKMVMIQMHDLCGATTENKPHYFCRIQEGLDFAFNIFVVYTISKPCYLFGRFCLFRGLTFLACDAFIDRIFAESNFKNQKYPVR